MMSPKVALWTNFTVSVLTISSTAMKAVTSSRRDFI